MCKKAIFVLGVLFCAFEISAQKLNVVTYRRDNPFLNSQWYIGPRAGANMALIQPINSFSVLTPNNTFDTELYDKSYAAESSIGSQYGFQAIFKFSQRFMIATMPSYVNYKFSYENQISWQDSNRPEEVTTLAYNHRQNLNYIQLPILLRFEVKQRQAALWNRTTRKPRTSIFTPYVQLGPYIDFRLGANKEVDVSQIEQNLPINFGTYTLNVSQQFNMISGGLMAGGGFKLKITSFYLTAEANYKLGLNNIVNPGRRYTNTQLVSTVYDVFDDMRLNAVELNVGVMIPLKYLTPGNALPIDP